MIAALALARTYWKPVALIVAALWLYSAGYNSASRACKAASLKDEITELKRQSVARKNVIEQAEKDRLIRDSEIANLSKKVEDYENDIGKQNQCVLTPADTKRLRAIR